jgi:hypothetical protein
MPRFSYRQRANVSVGGGNEMKCCDLVYWKHEDGWDVYNRSDCRSVNGVLVPNWFDNFVIEDAPTKAAAVAEIKSQHFFGICLVNS